jgi:uncharacterized membrane protein YkvI
MSEPVKRSHWSLHREPSYVLLMLGIVLTTFGFSWLVNGRHPVVAVVLIVVGLALLIPMRVLRSRTGRWP